MTKSAFKDIFREGSKSISRFIAILIISMIGVAVFAGIKSTSPSMNYTADTYYDDCNMADLRVLSTMGLTENDITAIAALDGVQAVQPGYFTDAVALCDTIEYTFRIHSMPKLVSGAQSSDTMNRLSLVTDEKLLSAMGRSLVSGRLPETAGECVVELTRLVDHGLNIGDTITVSSGTSEDITDGVLSTNVFTVVGFVNSPVYTSCSKGSTSVGAGTLNFFMYTPESSFSYSVYTEAYITVKGAKAYDAYSDEYTQFVGRTLDAIENLGLEQCQLRIEDIRAEATNELNSAKDEYAAAKLTYDTSIAEGEAELKEANTTISTADGTLQAQKEYYAAQLEDANTRISDGEKDLQNAQDQYDATKRQVDETLAVWNPRIAEYQSAVDQAQAIVDSLQAEKANWQAVVNDPNSTPAQVFEAQVAISNLSEPIDTATAKVAEYQQALDDANAIVAQADVYLAEAKQTITDSQKKLDESKELLKQKTAESDAAIADAEARLEQAKNDYTEAETRFNEEKKAGELQLSQANDKLYAAEAEISLLTAPTWYSLDRRSFYSYSEFEQTSEQMNGIAEIFPVFFFIVAALVCQTTMTRMVGDQRGYMGIYKALGYSNAAVYAKYTVYAGFASFIGSALGAFIGLKFIPSAIFSSYSLLYTMPALKTKPDIIMTVAAGLICMAITVGSALLVAASELKTNAAVLMRPKAPPAGKRILLERITFLWRLFSFKLRVTFRNMFRYKKKLIMTLLGVAGCSALILAGFGISDTIGQVVEKQFSYIYRYDIIATLNTTSGSDGYSAVETILNSDDSVQAMLTAHNETVSVSTGGEDVSVTATIPTYNRLKFNEYVRLIDTSNGEEFDLPESGIVLTDRLARKLGVKIGDSVKLTMDNGKGDVITRRASIARITEQYYGHYIYMSSEYYNEVFKGSLSDNAFLIKLNNATSEAEQALGSKLIATGCVSSAKYYSTVAEDFTNNVSTLNSVVYMIIGFAGLLAFVVIYNLTNINIIERIREIATIKVLGFYNSESFGYVFRENVFITILGSAVGLVFGIFLHKFIMTSIEMESVTFGSYISPLSYLYAFALTLAFSLLVSLLTAGKIVKVPMVESLKSVE